MFAARLLTARATTEFDRYQQTMETEEAAVILGDSTDDVPLVLPDCCVLRGRILKKKTISTPTLLANYCRALQADFLDESPRQSALWFSQPVEYQPRHLPWLFAVQKMPRASDQFKAVLAAEVLGLIGHQFSA